MEHTCRSLISWTCAVCQYEKTPHTRTLRQRPRQLGLRHDRHGYFRGQTTTETEETATVEEDEDEEEDRLVPQPRIIGGTRVSDSDQRGRLLSSSSSSKSLVQDATILASKSEAAEVAATLLSTSLPGTSGTTSGGDDSANRMEMAEEASPYDEVIANNKLPVVAAIVNSVTKKQIRHEVSSNLGSYWDIKKDEVHLGTEETVARVTAHVREGGWPISNSHRV